MSFTPWIDDSPADEICPCCGIQFGYDDSGYPDQASRQHILCDMAKKMDQSRHAMAQHWHPGTFKLEPSSPTKKSRYGLTGTIIQVLDMNLLLQAKILG